MWRSPSTRVPDGGLSKYYHEAEPTAAEGHVVSGPIVSGLSRPAAGKNGSYLLASPPRG